MFSDSFILAENLAKQYRREVWGIVDVTFKVRKGEICALLGPNGAGKTTTVNILSTLIKPTYGRAFVGGFDVVREPDKVREIAALVPQDSRPDTYWTPREAIQWYLVIRGFSMSRAKREAEYWVERLGLADVKDTPSLELSGGQRKRVLIAMAIASDAQVLFLDEPSTGLDVEGKHELVRVVREAAKDGRTVVITTHDMREAEIIADSIVIINKGRVMAAGSPLSLIEEMPYKCKVVVRGSKTLSLNTNANVKSRVTLGDAIILYFSSCSEADTIAGELGLEAEKISLEDAYLYYVNGGSFS